MSLFGFGRDKDGDPSCFENAELPVSDKMIWICEKCGSKLADVGDEDPARSLQKAVKGLISDAKRKREVRVMVTSCMNVCPSRKIAAAVADLKGGKVRFVEFEYRGKVEKTAEDLYRLL